VGLQLPGELRALLDILGYTWPASDEEKLFELGQAWIEFSDTLAQFAEQAGAGATAVLSGNRGGDIDAFQAWWSGDESPLSSVLSNTTASIIGGAGIIICAAIVLAMKIAVVVQLVILAIQIAQAIATAAPTFGASLLEIPIFQQLARTIVGNIIQECIWQLIDG
jgi:hypothetical protein